MIVSFRPTDRGATLRDANVRVLIGRVLRGAAGDGPSWSDPTEEPALTPLKLRWGHSGQPATLTLANQLGAGPCRNARIRPEQTAGEVGAGDEVILVHDVGGESVELFRGWIGQESQLIQANPDVEARTLVAYGPELRLRGVAAHGQWHKTQAVDDKYLADTLTATDATRANAWASDLPVIFNRAGRPNASQAATPSGTDAGWALDDAGDRDGRVFEPADRKVQAPDSAGNVVEAEAWTAYTAARSLLAWCDNGERIRPHGLIQAKAMLADVPIGQVVAEGLDLLAGLRAILSPVGFGFRITPFANEDGRFDIAVFKLHPDAPTAAEPVMADVSAGNVDIESDAGQAAMVQRLEFLRDGHNVRNRVTVVGDQRRVQVALEFTPSAGSRDLHPMWDTGTNDLADYDTDDVVADLDTDAIWLDRYCRGGEATLDYYHAFRSFAWNEDGALADVIDVVPDLATYGVGASYTRRPRPLGATLIHNTQHAGRLPAYVELGIVGDDDAWILCPEARVMTDRCGVTIDAPRLDSFRPYSAYTRSGNSKAAYADDTFATLLHNALAGNSTEHQLRLRVVGTVECDDALAAESEQLTGSIWPFAAERIEYLPERFGRGVVADNPSGLPTDARDDAADAQAYADRCRDVYEDAMGHGSIVLRAILTHWRPGDAVAGTTGRDVSLAVGAGGDTATDGVYYPIIDQIVWDFQEGVNKTELVLDSPLLKVSQ